MKVKLVLIAGAVAALLGATLWTAVPAPVTAQGAAPAQIENYDYQKLGQ